MLKRGKRKGSAAKEWGEAGKVKSAWKKKPRVKEKVGKMGEGKEENGRREGSGEPPCDQRLEQAGLGAARLRGSSARSLFLCV